MIDLAPDLHVSTFCGHESRMIHSGLELRVRHPGHSAVRIERDDEKRGNALGTAFFADDEIAGHRMIGRHVLSPMRSRQLYYRPPTSRGIGSAGIGSGEK